MPDVTPSAGTPTEGPPTARRIPAKTVSRLPRYLQALVQAADHGAVTISSDDLARASGVNSANVRKDLSFLGAQGIRGVGYDVGSLTAEISDVLGLGDDRPVMIVGVGNLGRALATYHGFVRRGFTVAALVDADPAKVGVQVGHLKVEPFDDVARIVAERAVTIAVLAIPAEHAQAAADALTGAGVTAILNFAPVHLEVPDGVSVRTVDLSTELQILSFYGQATAPPGRQAHTG